jgi:protein PhnA
MSSAILFFKFLDKNNVTDNSKVLRYTCRLFRQYVGFWRAHSRRFALFQESIMQLPHCPKCNSEYTYEDNGLFICPECAHEWNDAEPAPDSDALIVKDANGNLLADGDNVTVIKDLKVKGSSSMLKIGTKVKGIRLVEGDHNIDCKIDGFGPMKLKSEFVKKN